jgi:2,3-bisphosphoglycerate-dependent phosphoglycerate mutase
MELYFIRHGQSINNANWDNPDYEESPDPTLTENGHEQAHLLAEFLKKNQQITNEKAWNSQNRYGFGLTHIYTSLMERAAFTAAPIAQALDIPLMAWKEIHEEGGIYSRGDKNNVVGLGGRPRSFFMQNFRTITLPDDLDETGWWNRPFEAEDERQPRADQALLNCSPATRIERDSQSIAWHLSVMVVFSCVWFAPSSNSPGGRLPTD